MGKRPRVSPPATDHDDLEYHAVQTEPRPRIATSEHSWPPGPADLESLFDWPAAVLEAICRKPAMRDRLKSLVAKGIISNSDYSGIDTHREVCHQLGEAMQKSEHFHPWQNSEPRFKFVRSCDWDAGPQQVLLAIARDIDHGRSCVFENMENRLPPEAIPILDGMQPPVIKKGQPTLKQLQQSQQAYADMLEWLIMNKEWLYHDAKSPCLVHGGRPTTI
jgi:hypothetical protein